MSETTAVVTPNWKKAPSSATHWGPARGEFTEAWYRIKEGVQARQFVWVNDWYTDPVRLTDERVAMLVERPSGAVHIDPAAPGSDRTVTTHMLAGEVVAVWEGCIPPVGVKCQYRILPVGIWHECTVSHILRPMQGCPPEVVILCDHLNGEQVVRVGSDKGAAEFRPVPTPEQVDRMRQIGIMNGLLGNGASHAQGRDLFEHGFRQALGYAELVALAKWVDENTVLRPDTRDLIHKARYALAASRGDA